MAIEPMSNYNSKTIISAKLQKMSNKAMNLQDSNDDYKSFG
jgi:hypothetical protein